MDTILQCFIVDEANQKKKEGKTALYAPEEIQGLIDAPEEWLPVLLHCKHKWDY